MSPSMSNILRPDQKYVAQWVKDGSRVLDLGCSDGALLAYLRDEKNCTVLGIDLDDVAVLATLERGIDVIQQDLESGLALFEHNAFDVVLQLETLQQIHHVKPMLTEIARVGREAILSFPNFGYWRNRLQITRGNMPVSKSLPYEWFNTPNVHLCTIHDFDQFCKNHNITILERKVITDTQEVSFMPNLLGNLAMYRLKAK